MVKVVWITHEQRSRDIIPIICQLRRGGHEAELHFTDIFQDINHAISDDDKEYVVVVQSSEDFSYAKDVWAWEKYGEVHTVSPENIAPLVRDSTRVILVHPHHETADLHDDIKALEVIIEHSNQDALLKILEFYPISVEIPQSLTASLPLAKRLVFIRHAQRLDEVNKKWCDLAARPQDSPLTEMGIEQSRHLGAWIASQQWASDIAGMMVSPFIRTVQTAHFATDNDQLRHTQICVEYGLAEGAPWMAQNALCQTPWHLKSGDLFSISTRVALDYESVKHPQFTRGEQYPGRPVEKEEWYDRCAQTVWRIARHPQYDGKTLVLVTHAGCINYLVHALCGRHLPMVGHTAVTSLVCDEYHGQYSIEHAAGTDKEIFVDQDHLPPELRSGHH
jgi:broad specificity phosphatase PhoE